MRQCKVFEFYSSSSATAYGDASIFPDMIPIPERFLMVPANPYGSTECTIKKVLIDLLTVIKRARRLPYSDPIGAFPFGLIGEESLGIPNNSLPCTPQAAVVRREKVSVFSDDCGSRGGTPIAQNGLGEDTSKSRLFSVQAIGVIVSLYALLLNMY